MLLASTTAGPAQEAITFDSWRSRCLETPSNRTLQMRMPAKEKLPIQDFGIVSAQARNLLEHLRDGTLADDQNWLGEKPKPTEFFDIDRSYFTRPPLPFQPFTQKLQIPPGSHVIFHGDFHGDIRSFIATLDWLNANGYLDGFQLKRPNTYFVFLGDYVDRGSYGVEVLYTLMRLKLANPEHVILARGNHEDYKMTATYGFLREGEMKYGRAFDPLPLWRVYDFMPVVIYLGVGKNYVQCNHGGMEPGYDPKTLLANKKKLQYQLLGELKQKSFAAEHPAWLAGASDQTLAMANEKLADFRPQTPVLPQPIGFMWNDYFIFAEEPVIGFNASRLAFNHGQASTEYLLDQASSDDAKLRAVFRAHQHSSVPTPAMNRIVASRGAFRHWQATDSTKEVDAKRDVLETLVERTAERTVPDGSVWTFNVSPDSVYGAGNDYTFDTIGILTTAESFEKWRLRVVNVPVSTQ